jgi:hypothetical protein
MTTSFSREFDHQLERAQGSIDLSAPRSRRSGEKQGVA